MAKACKDFGFFTSKIFNNKTHLFRLSGFTTYSMTASYLVKVTALTANTDGKINRLVMVFAAPCSHDKSCQNLHPDTRTYPQYKSCNVTDFWLRDKLYRDTPGFDKTCTWICKNHSIPSLHRDSFVAKVSGP